MSSITGQPRAVALNAATAPEPVRLPVVSGDGGAGPHCPPQGPALEVDEALEVVEALEVAASQAAPVTVGPRWIASAPLWMRYAAGSIVATVLSQIALTVAYGLLGATAVVASIVAFFAGTIPNYFLNKAWAWGGHKVSHRRLIVSYLLVIVVTNVAAIGMTLAADSYVRAHIRSDGPRTVLLDLAYVTSNGLMFVVKCVLFDGVLFKPRRRRRAKAVEGAGAGVHVP